LAAVKAFDKYDDSKGMSLSSYVALVATAYIRRHLNHFSGAVAWDGGRGVRQVRANIGKVEPLLIARGVREEDMAEEIARYGGFSLADVEHVLEMRDMSSCSLEKVPHVHITKNTPESLLEERNAVTRVQYELVSISTEYGPRFKEAVLRRYIEEQTFREIGEALGISKQRVSQMVQKVYVELEERVLAWAG
jgi:RNA polymerase sigma factor (sigma-70 family)